MATTLLKGMDLLHKLYRILLKRINFIDEQFPNLKKNLKFHLAKRDKDQFHVPRYLPPEVKLVDCGGRPKPDQLAFLPFIKSNWHDI